MQSRGNWLLYCTRFSPTLLIIRLFIEFQATFSYATPPCVPAKWLLCHFHHPVGPSPGPLAYAEESGIGVGLLPMMYSHYQQAVLSI